MNRIIAILLLLQLCIKSNAQHKTYIGDTSTIEYFKDRFNRPIDSITWDKMEGKDTSCMVFYEKEMKTIAFRSYLKGDTEYRYDYWRNGELKQKTIVVFYSPDNHLWIWTEAYCQNGQLIEKYNHADTAIRHRIGYYCNGQKQYECDFGYKYGTQGEIKVWYEDGKLKELGHKQIKNGHGEVEGDWNYYNENGKIDSTEVYKNSVIVETIKY
jgi:antitoxin component YwqK of YwqJK toxin-antitoxin module